MELVLQLLRLAANQVLGRARSLRASKEEAMADLCQADAVSSDDDVDARETNELR